MQQVQNEAYSLTDELRRIQKDEKTSAAQRAVRAREIARRDTETLLKKTDAKPQPVKEFVPLKEVQIGQEVVIADLGQTATVTARPDRSGMVEVRAGIMKTKVPLTNLRAPDKMEKRKPAEPRRSTRVQLDKSRKTSMELNLLGYTVRKPWPKWTASWTTPCSATRTPCISSTATAPARCATPSKSTCAPTAGLNPSALAAMVRARAA